MFPFLFFGTVIVNSFTATKQYILHFTVETIKQREII